MPEKEFKNGYIKLWKKIDAFTPELREIYFHNWDETGRSRDEKTENRAIIAILKKNTEAGYVGFKLDMNTLFDKEAFSEKQLETYYNVYVAGARHLADKLIEGNPPTSKVKP